jgi:hypothetical protein
MTQKRVSEMAQAEIQQMAAPRPLTYHQASSVYPYTGDARERHDDLTHRRILAQARATLIARGEYDPAKHGTEEHEPLSVDEHLEVIATGEIVARTYRHPADVDRALKADASWEQVAAARGCDEAQARADYREWAEGQHHLWASDYSGGGKFGMNDAEYAKAIARAGEPEPAAAKAYAGRTACCARMPTRTAGARTGWSRARSAWRARLSVRRRRGEMAGPHDRDWAGAGFTKPGPRDRPRLPGRIRARQGGGLRRHDNDLRRTGYILHRRLHQRPPRHARPPSPQGQWPGSTGRPMSRWTGPRSRLVGSLRAYEHRPD